MGETRFSCLQDGYFHQGVLSGGMLLRGAFLDGLSFGIHLDVSYPQSFLSSFHYPLCILHIQPLSSRCPSSSTFSGGTCNQFYCNFGGRPSS